MSTYFIRPNAAATDKITNDGSALSSPQTIANYATAHPGYSVVNDLDNNPCLVFTGSAAPVNFTLKPAGSSPAYVLTFAGYVGPRPPGR